MTNQTIRQPSNILISFIKSIFHIFNDFNFDFRRPLSFILWVMQDRNNGPEFFDKFAHKNISLQSISADLNNVFSEDDFLCKCCGNEIILLARLIDMIFFRDESPLRIAKADIENRLRDFITTVYQSGDYKRKVFCHIYNMKDVESPNEAIFGDYKLQILKPFELPILTGENSLLSSLHPYEPISFYLTKEDEIPCNNEELPQYIDQVWKEAFFYLQPLKYLNDSPVGLDYLSILFSPPWLNSIRREGIYLIGKPLRPITDNLYQLTNDDINFLKKWQAFYNIKKIREKLDQKESNLRKTIEIAGTYYENYMLKEEMADQFIFLIFALEALFSPMVETVYKISMHCSTLLSDYGINRKEIYIFVKKMLSKRNKFVHGSKLFNELGISRQEITKLASLIRLSIRQYLSLYLRGEKKKENLLNKLETIALGTEDYITFDKEKDIVALVEVTLEKGQLPSSRNQIISK